MAKAFVLLVCEPGSDDNVVSKLLSMETVTSARGVFGLYDVIAQLNSDSLEILEDVITKKIRRLEKILKTITLLTETRTEVLDEVFAQKQKDLGKDTVEAFIIVSCKNMNEHNILVNLSKIPEVIDSDIVLGHDVIICKVSAPTYNDIEDIVTKKIRKLQGIISTMTLNVIPDKQIH